MKKILILLITTFIFYQWVNAENNTQNITTAQTYLNNWEYQKAIDIYENLIDENINSNEVISQLLYAYSMNGNFDKALLIMYGIAEWSNYNENIVWFYIEEDNISQQVNDALKQVQKTNGKDALALVEYAKALYKAWDYYYYSDKEKYYFPVSFAYFNAYVALEQAWEIDKNNSEVYFYQWRLLMDTNWDFYTAEQKLKKAISLNKDNFEYYYRLWNSYMHQKKHKEARSAFLMGIKLNKNYEKLYLNLGNTYFALWDKTKWFAAYNTWVKICSEMCSGFYNNLWNEYRDNNNSKLAIIYYTKALKIDPNYRNAKCELELLKTGKDVCKDD